MSDITHQHTMENGYFRDIEVEVILLKRIKYSRIIYKMIKQIKIYPLKTFI